MQNNMDYAGYHQIMHVGDTGLHGIRDDNVYLAPFVKLQVDDILDLIGAGLC